MMIMSKNIQKSLARGPDWRSVVAHPSVLSSPGGAGKPTGNRVFYQRKVASWKCSNPIGETVCIYVCMVLSISEANTWCWHLDTTNLLHLRNDPIPSRLQTAFQHLEGAVVNFVVYWLASAGAYTKWSMPYITRKRLFGDPIFFDKSTFDSSSISP